MVAACAELLEPLAVFVATTQLLRISCPDLSVVVTQTWEGRLGRGTELDATDILVLPLFVIVTPEELGVEPGAATEVAKVVAVTVISDLEAALSAARIFFSRESMAAVSIPSNVSYQ